MINQKLLDFEEDVKPLGDIMTQVHEAKLRHFNYDSEMHAW